MSTREPKPSSRSPATILRDQRGKKDRQIFATRPSCLITTHADLPSCTSCGRCCHLVVELREGDHVPETLVVEHAGVRCMDQRGDGACVALDPATRLCTIYESRPLTCREFARGESLCRRILGRTAGAALPLVASA